MLSLIISYVISSLMYEGRIKKLIEDTLIQNGDKIIHAYRTTPSADLVPFMQNLSGLSGSLLQLYNKDGAALLDGNPSTLPVSKADINRVLSGAIIRDIDTGGSQNVHIPHYPIVGIPFEAGDQTYGLFVTVDKNPVEVEIMNSVHLMYVLILFLGSLLILVAARYIVHPILRLTQATKLMAKGRFDVVLQSKRKDEIGVLSASFDEMAQELAKLDQMRQDFVSNVSHEIQTPLTSISGFSKALKFKKMSEESRIHYLTIIEHESERLSRLSQSLLQLSHLQHELHPLKRSKYRLDRQLREVVIALEPQWSAKGIEMDVGLEAITVHADEDQLKQVWINLLNNSIKFTPERGVIRMKAEQKDGLISVSITDTGIGIPEEERVNIFKPFHKVDKSRNPSVKGNGLGLSIVKKIVDLHTGDIQVSGTPGIGSTFTVTLPE